MSFADVEHGVFILGTCHCKLLASHTVIAYVENQRLNAICLNLFRIKSTQSSGHMHEQN